MINACFFKTYNGWLKGFKIQGHSMLNQHGYDIVCAAVSSAAYLVANTATEILKANPNITINDGEMTFEVTDEDMVKCRDILLGLRLHLISLEEQYPQNIKVNYTEV